MEEKKKGSRRIRYLSKTPNIKSSNDEPLILGDHEPDALTHTTNEIQAKEANLEFRSEDIKQKDDSKLFVKVEGADRIAREKERAAKKKDDELIKRLQTAANKRKKENRAAKRKASKLVRDYKLKEIWTQIVRFRILIMFVISLAILIPTALVIFHNVQKVVEQQRAVNERTAQEKLIKDNYTDMLKIYTQLAGTEKTKEEVNTIVEAFEGDIAAYYLDKTEGLIVHDDGGLDSIRFSINRSNKQIIVYNFYFNDIIDDNRISIYGSEDSYHFVYNGNDQKYDNINDAIKSYILKTSKQL